MLNLTLIGQRISKRRKELNITQTNLAETLFVTHQAVSKWENGKSLPTIDILYELTKVLDISIDYLLNDTDILEHDYETMFQNYPRETVLNHFFSTENWEEDILEIFYLLNNKERFKVINQIISKQVCYKIKELWPYFNPEERIYVLGVILSGKCNVNLNSLKRHLTIEEQLLVHKQSKGYKLHYYKE